ncbi:oxidoreductase C-terminal domain-containing protein [Arthrobacter hankyongi]|uniref:oxidoreductase C-terminal domain-containing protein n=1 Tax=Arthrobacter hankyongi TaxID=2904801 RepID=UPI003558C1A3
MASWTARQSPAPWFWSNQGPVKLQIAGLADAAEAVFEGGRPAGPISRRVSHRSYLPCGDHRRVARLPDSSMAQRLDGASRTDNRRYVNRDTGDSLPASDGGREHAPGRRGPGFRPLLTAGLRARLAQVRLRA